MMQQLRFPNSGITAKAQPPARRQPAAAKAPLQRGDRLRPGPMQEAAARRGSSLQGWPPAGVASARRNDWLRPARKGLPPAARPQGAARPPAANPQGPVARGQAARGGCPQRACKGVARPRPALPPAQGQRRQRRRGWQREG
ncbi:hypothetical protein GW17_00052537 [Ensete ventricosum]|nr:hypothetical protein GW17_00052537 [Ensete ventricosum]